MTCSVLKKDRSEYVQNLVLDFFQELVGAHRTVTMDTFLGPLGLGDGPARRKLYYGPLADRLAVKGCAMRSLKPNDFGDTKSGATIQTISDMIEKDLV